MFLKVFLDPMEGEDHKKSYYNGHECSSLYVKGSISVGFDVHICSLCGSSLCVAFASTSKTIEDALRSILPAMPLTDKEQEQIKTWACHER